MNVTAHPGAIGVTASPASHDLIAVIGTVCDDYPSASMGDLKELALLICRDCGLGFGLNKVNHLVVRFTRAMPHGSAWAFFLFFTNELQISVERRRRLLGNPDIARVVSYPDKTGEDAVNHVMRGRGW